MLRGRVRAVEVRLALLAVIAALHVYGQMNPTKAIGYLWYNPIGCAVCVVVSLLVQAMLGSGPRPAERAASAA